MRPAVIISTFPDRRSLGRVARAVVSDRLAACVNIVPISSVYRWKGRIESGPEYLGIFKTTKAGRAALKRAIAAMHPYDVPEIAEIDASANAPYMDWIAGSVTARPKSAKSPRSRRAR